MRTFVQKALAASAIALFFSGPLGGTVVLPTAAMAQSQSQSQAPAQSSFAPAAQPADEAAAAATNAAIDKMNAYVAFLNRSLRASESLERYASWVNMKKGLTGKERNVLGLYPLYDVRSEIAAVETAAAAEPKMPDLDAAILAYVETYQQLAPVIEKANKYYERQDYKSDKMEGAKAYHKEIAALAPTYEARRKAADAALRTEKVKVDLISLEALEKAEGKKSRWQVRNVMIRAETVMDLMPDNDRPVVDMPAFEAALADYATAVRQLDDYAIDHPNSFHVFESRPATLLSKLRDFDEKLQKAKGDARKGAGRDLDRIVFDYNMMVSTAQTATTFAKD